MTPNALELMNVTHLSEATAELTGLAAAARQAYIEPTVELTAAEMQRLAQQAQQAALRLEDRKQ